MATNGSVLNQAVALNNIIPPFPTLSGANPLLQKALLFALWQAQQYFQHHLLLQ